MPALNYLAATSQSQILYGVKTKLAVQFSRQLLRRTTVNHLVKIQNKIIQIIVKCFPLHDHDHDQLQVSALSPMMLATTGRRLQVLHF